MPSASGPNDVPSRRRSRQESDAAVPEQSASALTAASWTLDTNVEFVLLRGAAPPADMKLSAFLRSIGEGIAANKDVAMRHFIFDPTYCIQNNRQQERVLNSQEFMAFELFYKVAPFLRGKQSQLSSSGQRVDAVSGLLRVRT
ncbi:hypothetical protein ERJ75_001394300 [Trypanosoma vivax]|nr:hypothetical protein ERJ75_001394300 [Trypanosoma vivax]